MKNINLNLIIKIFVFVIIILAGVLLFGSLGSKAKLELIGENEITIYQNSVFTDPGYNITETDKPDDFYVTTEGFVNINKTGIYNIEYLLHSKNGKTISTLSRKVIVLEDKLTNVNIKLKGDEEEYFFVNDYIDHGAEAYRDDIDISNEINIVSDIKSETIGKYEVKYQITNGNYEKEAIRKVNIIDYYINENIDYVNLVIDLTIECDNFDYVILPDGKKVYSKYTSYNFDDVGNYDFDVFLKSGSHKKYTINIASIDSTGPTGTCKVTYDNNKTNVTMNVTDPSGISKFSYNGLDFYGNTTLINSIVPNITIRAYDKRNNYSDIKCRAEYGTGFRNINVSNDGRVQGKQGYIKCGTDVSKESQEVEALMQSYGYKTRGAVAAAGAYLATYKYDLPYFWGGKWVKKGFNPDWGCTHHVYGKQVCSKAVGSDSCEWGLDCTGLVSWAFAQAGFDYDVIRQDSMSEGRWGNFNARTHRYDFNKNNMNYINQIKPGDIVHREGHVGLVIGVDANNIQIVEMLGPIFVSTLDKTTGRGLSKQKGFTDFVLMDEFYTMYGNS